jgi:hypothetical protein
MHCFASYYSYNLAGCGILLYSCGCHVPTLTVHMILYYYSSDRKPSLECIINNIMAVVYHSTDYFLLLLDLVQWTIMYHKN